MDEQYQDYSVDYSSKLRDIEEKQRLLSDRVLLIGKSLIDERDRNFKEIQELKKVTLTLKEDISRIKEFIQRASEQIEKLARKDELLILQKQFDLFRT